MGVGRRRSEPGAERNPLTRRQHGARRRSGPRIDLLVRGIADRESQMRHVRDLAGIVDDVASDHEDRHIFMLFGCGGEAVKIEAAQINRQTDPGVERRGLRQDAHEVGAPADHDRIENDQRQDAPLQPRQ